MKKPMCQLLLLLIGGLVTTSLHAYQVVAHSGVAASSISKADLSKIFLVQSKTWPGGGVVIPVDQQTKSLVRKAFCKDVHGKKVMSAWKIVKKAMMNDDATPPKVKKGDEAVLEFIAATPNSIGYIDDGLAATGVKVLTVN